MFRQIMKILIAAIIIAAIAFIGVSQSCRLLFKSMQSNTVGITREITLYNANGEIIQQWYTDKSAIDIRGNTVSWIQYGKRIIISGTFTIIETTPYDISDIPPDYDIGGVYIQNAENVTFENVTIEKEK